MTDASRYITQEAVQAAISAAERKTGLASSYFGAVTVPAMLEAAAPFIRAAVLREIAMLPTRPTRGELLRMADEAVAEHVPDQCRWCRAGVRVWPQDAALADETVAVYDPPQSETTGPADGVDTTAAERNELIPASRSQARRIELTDAPEADQADTIETLARLLTGCEAAIERVRALHTQPDDGLLAPGKWCPACGGDIPCPTISALDGGDVTHNPPMSDIDPWGVTRNDNGGDV